ncbi:protoporphyrinogen IX oxidase [Thermosynechococcus vestitus BP-1]|uniref:Release factor glutamine methyltransferase n=1 Tax=Thermosynechococcus vestitus (strain NIES-2133 / IAM M-273 / BP-1) TaxID=197221 RepID=PRMC_THEVB|nr:RecName: Full=Release factor glutamine methyltransferase; Short=RF MTase; AltName: Full=N5-glutamine methyltransferase PrmC; AltName: Full=Protein-(glutamine-N5) MTase PrmC; AltName: Full=Protein-glutamine N-methyltransferase PrmC [Thermosynechococcus vestitus BP-1]BAC09388.1 protoporphyrinogen IX oxidase [Thermosynechococcus vestitus BP-1]BAY53155.1 protoporphyrinogen IX oxidase [Thermostichus vulcanus NIES-2134]
MSGEALQRWWHWAQGIIPAPERESGLRELKQFLRAFTGLSPLEITLRRFPPQIHLKLPLTELQERWQRRWQERVPLQYLIGVAHWHDLELVVTPSVLIPRPETEELLAVVAATVPPWQQQGHWLDLGTGSGAIAIGLARLFPAALIHAVDCSSEALEVAQVNIQKYALGDRVRCYVGNWFDPIVPLQGQVQGIVSNPPYIPTSVVATLQPEVQYHEPLLALDGGTDGLQAIRQILETAPEYLQPQGWLFIELMATQGKAVAALAMATQAYERVEILRDLSGHDRFLLAQTP